MHALYKQFDKNGDGKITSEDIEIYLKEMGLGFVSPCECLRLIQLVFCIIDLCRFG
jgi:Ca2+-binding EF-hand superfamily protein